MGKKLFWLISMSFYRNRIFLAVTFAFCAACVVGLQQNYLTSWLAEEKDVTEA